jgi:hypothetical protein
VASVNMSTSEIVFCPLQQMQTFDQIIVLRELFSEDSIFEKDEIIIFNVNEKHQYVERHSNWFLIRSMIQILIRFIV